MAPTEWDEIFEIFHAAREKPAGERVPLLDTACGENTAFRKAVEELLRHDEAATGFLGQPLFASSVDEPKPSPVRAGQQFGRYATVELIGRGGIGEVWSAHDTDLDRPVALKFLCNEELVGLNAHQITHEAKTASGLNHPGIITIYEVVHSEYTFAIAMELVDGRSLRDVYSKPIATPVLVSISLQIAQALGAAHTGGIVHGDIKPENILLRRDRYIKLVDFGLARKVTAETIALGLPALGTLRYMSPEQARGEPLTPASDIFSLGLVLYELATGHHAFSGNSPLDTAHAIVTSEPDRAFPAHVPAALQDLILSMLSKSPASRPSAGKVVDALEGLRAIPESSPVSLPPKTTLSWRFWAGLVGALVAIACATTWLVKGKREGPELADLTITPLTSQTGWEANPALSPDGNSVAFTWSPQLDVAKQVYIKRATDIEPVKLAGSEGGMIGHLAWSPDGKRIAFKRQFDRRGALYSISSSGQDERKLVELANASPSSAFDWSADGEQLVFSDSPPDAPEHQAIYLYNLHTGQRRQLTSPPLEIWGDSYPKFSPDGRTIAFKRVTGVWVDDIYLIPSSGGRLRRLTYDGRGIWGLAWMPDGKSLLVSCQRNGTIFGIWRLPLRSHSNPELVAQGGGVDAITPDTARHSQRVAWVNQVWDLNIYRVASSGTGRPVRLIASTLRDQDAVYAPDGRIAWISDRSGTREVWLSREDGSSQVQITHLNRPQIDHLRWSFDGRYLAFDSRLFGYSDIFVLECPPGHIACSGPKALKIFPAECPGWSADSKSVYFSSDRTGKWEIWKQSLSGGGPVQITDSGGYYPNESPDGKWLYFSDRHIDSTILRMPGSQGTRSAPKESLVLGRPYRVQQEGWAVSAEEIIFIDRPALGRPAAIRAFNLLTGKVRSILEIPEVFLDRADIRVSVSADGKSVLYAQLDRSGSNIILADKTR